jgi:hypothetical protein
MSCIRGVIFGFALLLPAGVFAAMPLDTVTVEPISRRGPGTQGLTFARFFARGEIPECARAVDSEPLATQCDAKTRWPDGSLQFAVISFVQPARSKRGKHTLSFHNQQCRTDGYLTKENILDPSAPWASNLGAEIAMTRGSQTQIFDLRAMLNDWDGKDGGVNGPDVRYWLKGPVSSQLIVENKSTRAYDKGWAADGSLDSHRSLHPIFVVTIWNNLPAVKIETIVENMWTTALQDQKYDFQVRLGNPLQAAQWVHTGYTQYARTRWHRTFWSGRALGNYALPDDVKIDLNLPYMIYSGILPQYDVSRKVSSGTVQRLDRDIWNNYSAARRDINGDAHFAGPFPKGMQGTGQTVADWIGILPAWTVRFLFTMSDDSVQPSDSYPMLFNSAEVSGNVPIHLREGRGGPTKYCAHSCSGPGLETLAYGRPVSTDARPKLRQDSPNLTLRPADGTADSSLVTPVIPLSPSHGWQYDMAHQPAHTFGVYLITGDWYWLEEMMFWNQANLMTTSSGDGITSRGHFGWEGIINSQTRSNAWALRSMAQLVMTLPDAMTAEKTYWRSKLNNNIAAMEGRYSITDGAYYKSDIWNWANNGCGNGWGCLRDGQTNPLYIPQCANLPVGGRKETSYSGLWTAVPIAVTDNGSGKARIQLRAAVTRSRAFREGMPLYVLYVGGNVEGPHTVAGTDGSSYFDLDVPYQGGTYTIHPAGGFNASLVAYGGGGSTVGPWVDARYVPYSDSNFMLMMFWSVIGYMRDLGFPVEPIANRMLAFPIYLFTDGVTNNDHTYVLFGSELPGGGGNQSGVSRWNFVSADGRYYHDCTETQTAYARGYAQPQALKENYVRDASGSASAYAHILQAAVSYGYNLPNGREAWTVASARTPGQDLLNANPKWAIVPRTDPVQKIAVAPGDTFALFSYTAPSGSSNCSVDGISDGMQGTREHRFHKTGLTPGEAQHPAVISCDDDYYGPAVVPYKTVRSLQTGSTSR